MHPPWIWSPGELDRGRGPRLVLVLTRKANQSIMIGDDIEVTILSNDRAKVRIGIQAPAYVPVHRTEIYLEIQAQDRGSAGSEHDPPPARRRQAR